ncbi:jg25005, partial [Pararge aegeria aegeria]
LARHHPQELQPVRGQRVRGRHQPVPDGARLPPPARAQGQAAVERRARADRTLVRLFSSSSPPHQFHRLPAIPLPACVSSASVWDTRHGVRAEVLCSRHSLAVSHCSPPPGGALQALVLASLDEYRRPLGKVSTTQSATLAATGLIWTRYCLVIRPINYSLSVCNFSLGLANAVQCFRAYRFQRAARLGAV